MNQPLGAPAPLPNHGIAVRGPIRLRHLDFELDGDFLGPTIWIVEHVVINFEVEIIGGRSPAVEEQVQGSEDVRFPRVVLAHQNGQFAR